MIKRLFLVIVLMITLQPVYAFQDIIALETDTPPVFADTMLDSVESDDNPVSTVDDRTIYKEKNNTIRLHIYRKKY